MSQKTYQVTKDFKSPFVVATGLPHKPQQIKFKRFKKGELVKGELKHANNQPAFVLVGGALVLPLDAIKEVVSKEIGSNADGEKTATTESSVKVKTTTSPKIAILDGIVIGGLVGVLAVVIANKKQWIAVPEKINFLYGGLIGATLGAYLVYRNIKK